jgi:hypothetical protein
MAFRILLSNCFLMSSLSESITESAKHPARVKSLPAGDVKARVIFKFMASPTGFEPVRLTNGPLIPKQLRHSNDSFQPLKHSILQRFAAKLRRNSHALASYSCVPENVTCWLFGQRVVRTFTYSSLQVQLPVMFPPLAAPMPVNSQTLPW